MAEITVTEMMAALGLDLSEFERGLGTAQQSLRNAGRTMQQVGGTLTRRVTAPLVAMGTTAAVRFGQFESSMNTVQALTNATGADFQALTGIARQLGETTAFSATQAAQAQAFMARAGLETAQIYQGLPSTLNLAAAAQLDLGSSADIVTNVLAGLKLPVEELGRATDVLSFAANNANTDVRQLGQAFKFTGAIGTAAGISFEEMAAVLGELGNSGIQAGMAGRGFAAAIRDMLRPTDRARAELERLGISFTDSSGQLRSFIDIMREFEEKGVGVEDVFRIFTTQGARVVVTLLGSSRALGDFRDSLSEAGGTAQTLADVQMRGLRGGFLRFISAADSAAISVGERLAPYLIRLFDVMASGFRVIANLNPKILLVGIAFGALTAAIGPVLVGLGLMTSGIGYLLPLLAALQAKAAVVLVEMGAMAAPILAGVAALAALALATTMVVRHWDTLSDMVGRAVEDILAYWQDIYQDAREWLNDKLGDLLGPALGRILETAFGGIVGFANRVSEVWKFVHDEAKDWLNVEMGDVLSTMLQLITGSVGQFGVQVAQLTQNADEQSNTLADTFNRTAGEIANGFLAASDSADSATGGILGFFQTVGESATNAINPLGRFFNSMVENTDTGQAVMENFRAEMADIWSEISTAARNLVFVSPDAAGNAEAMLERMRTAFQEFVDAANGDLERNKVALDSWEERFDAWINTSAEKLNVWGELNRQVFTQFADGVSMAFARVIVDGENLEDQLRQVGQNIARNFIAALIRIGIQRVAAAVLATRTANAETAGTTAAHATQTFTGQMAAMSMAPFPVNLTAPQVASSMRAITLAAGAAGRIGGIAAGGGIGIGAEGAIVDRPTLALIGEAGPEMVTPLNRMRGNGPLPAGAAGMAQTLVVRLDGREMTRRVVRGMPAELNFDLGLDTA